MEQLFLLVQQTCDHPFNERLKESYKIVWLPLPSSDTWTDAEESSFIFLSDFLPWYAVQKPRLLSPTVVKYIREQWNYKDDPIMVTLDSNGKVTNFNALGMIKIWGAQAYPFSASKELWQNQNLTMQLLLVDINPLLAYWSGIAIIIYQLTHQCKKLVDLLTLLASQGHYPYLSCKVMLIWKQEQHQRGAANGIAMTGMSASKQLAQLEVVQCL